ncbi:hypothetical protein [Paludisphaera soli]|uniref:hypothetical protein n=1 Tax=Paludisphaera soli TaxID=2712865 RepID=UPI0013EC5BAF|nr:hypothetical protein [Paludisphaera soli]
MNPAISSKDHAMRPITASGAYPEFFQALCRSAARGGREGYEEAGRGLVAGLATLGPDSTALDEWAEDVDVLIGLVCPAAPIGRGSGLTPWALPEDGAVLAWFASRLPRCMARVPRRRRDSFLRGVYEHLHYEEGDVGF